MPTRRRTKAFESNPTLEFEHYLADRLSMTVDRLRVEMSAAEFYRWGVYYGRKAQRAELEMLRGR